MNEEEALAHSILVSLPRPQRPLPPRTAGKGRYESLHEMVKAAWEGDVESPRFAWVRYSLSVGSPLSTFIESFRGMERIQHAFGRRVFVHPVRLDHHEIEVADFNHSADPETGMHELEAQWRSKRCDGGTHVILAVSSSVDEFNSDEASGLEALNALEALVRLSFGAMIVVHPRQTLHIDLESGLANPVDMGTEFRTYGAAELPRTDVTSLHQAVDLARASNTMPSELAGRLSLGMRWANMAFNAHDFLMFWTAVEILSGVNGRRVFKVVATAYGSPRPQQLAKALGLNVICDLRNDLTHAGRPVHMYPQGASYLNAIAHDLARHIVGLPCLRLAESTLSGHQVTEWFQRIDRKC